MSDSDTALAIQDMLGALNAALVTAAERGLLVVLDVNTAARVEAGRYRLKPVPLVYVGATVAKVL